MPHSVRTLIDQLLPLSAFSCLLLAVVIWWVNRPPRPAPVSTLDLTEVASAKLYVYKLDAGIIFDEDEETGDYPIDSLTLSPPAARQALSTLLDGMHYVTNAYKYYHGLPVSDLYEFALCHDPHFSLLFYDVNQQIVGRASVCFACGNVYLSIGPEPYVSPQEYNISPEGEAAFLALQKRYFPEFHAAYLRR